MRVDNESSLDKLISLRQLDALSRSIDENRSFGRKFHHPDHRTPEFRGWH